eukprot:3247566-Pyramimonas_sp.AAC.1
MQGLLEARTRRHGETIEAGASHGATEAVHVSAELDRVHYLGLKHIPPVAGERSTDIFCRTRHW